MPDAGRHDAGRRNNHRFEFDMGGFMYERWITIKKMALEAGGAILIGGIPGVITWWATQEPVVPAMVFGIGMVVLRGLENWIKHRND